MANLSGKQLLFIGFISVLLGAVLPMLMVMRIIEPNYPLSFFSFACSVSGLFLGLVGAAKMIKLK